MFYTKNCSSGLLSVLSGRHSLAVTRLLPIAVAAFVLFGSLAVYAGVSTTDSYAAAKKYKVTITLKMGGNGSNCPVLFFYKNGVEKGLAYGSKWYVGSKRVSDPFSKSKSWFKRNSVNVVFTSVKLPKGTYRVVCDNGVKVKTVLSRLSVKKTTKKTVRF